jgi:hypothetical protein
MSSPSSSSAAEKKVEETKEKMIMLKSSDDETFEVEESVAMESQTIKHMIEDDCADSVIPLPNVTGEILARVIEYCKKHVEAASGSESDVAVACYSSWPPKPEDKLKDWDSEFVKVKHEHSLRPHSGPYTHPLSFFCVFVFIHCVLLLGFYAIFVVVVVVYGFCLDAEKQEGDKQKEGTLSPVLSFSFVGFSWIVLCFWVVMQFFFFFFSCLDAEKQEGDKQKDGNFESCHVLIFSGVFNRLFDSYK